jgi:hypothetical protein
MVILSETILRMRAAKKNRLCWLAGLAWLSAVNSGWAQADSLPLGYATNFSSVAYFEPPHELQVKARLSGTEASPLPGALFDLKQMKVEKFSTEGRLEAIVEAPQCVYAPLDHVATSPGHLELRSGDGKFKVEGDGFLWEEGEQSLVISNHVHTVINTQISHFTIL